MSRDEVSEDTTPSSAKRKISSVVGDDHDSRHDSSPVSKRIKAEQVTTEPSSPISRPVANRKKGEFAQGAIIRVKMINFVTYSHIEYNLGDALNMIVGPNGTGKSTFVCAICLGLNGSTSLLGRAKDLKEFVKNGEERATIEIEIQGFEGRSNLIVTREFDLSNKTTWYINGRKTSQKHVSETIDKFNIQVDNLCQFLPQDKVASFAQSSPEMLLQSTERAIGDPTLIQNHERLIALYTELSTKEHDGGGDKRKLEQLQSEQEQQVENIRALEELDQQRGRAKALETAIPVLRAKEVELKKDETKVKFEQAKEERRQLIERTGPFNDMSGKAVKRRDSAKRETDRLVQLLNGQHDELKTQRLQISRAAEKSESAQDQLADLATQEETFDQALDALNKNYEKCRKHYEEASEQQVDREGINECDNQNELLLTQKRENRTKIEELREKMRPLQEQIDNVKRDIEFNKTQISKLGDAEKRKLDAFRKINVKVIDITGQAVQYFRQMDKSVFVKEVFEPPVFTVRFKNNENLFLRQFSTLVRLQSQLTFTCQCPEDYDTFTRIFHDKKELNVNLRDISRDRPSSQCQPPVSEQVLKSLGFDCFLSDNISAPEPVMTMLYATSFIHVTPLSKSNLPLDIEKRIEKLCDDKGVMKIQRYADAEHEHNARKSKYGNQSLNVISSPLMQYVAGTAKLIAGGASDNDAQRYEDAIAELDSKHKDLEQEQIPIRRELAEAKDELRIITEELQANKDRRAELVKVLENIDKAKIRMERAKAQYESKKADRPDYNQEREQLEAKIAEYIESIQEASAGLAARADQQVKLQSQILVSTVDSRMYGNEAKVYDSLSRYGYEEIEQRINELRTIGHEYQNELRALKAQISRFDAEEVEAANEQIQEIGDNVDEIRRTLARVNASIEQLEEDVVPDARRLRREYEERQTQIAELETRINTHQEELDKIKSEIETIKSEWEPELQRLIQFVSDQFSRAFADIGCCGEVQLDRHPNYKHWAVKIMVSFREGTEMQPLTGQRQSGGERAVSTILYLMSLQELAVSPFRVVDEINQGMDPTNERMVHNRMVNVACKKSTSQYFLITPKLLTGLDYDPRMRVTCIFSGRHVEDASGQKITASTVCEVLGE